MVYYIGLMRPIKASIATTPPLTPDDTDSSNDRVVMVCHLIQTSLYNLYCFAI